MGERVRVVRHDGLLLAVKEPGADGPAGLRAEAEVLGRVQGPGVVELVGLRGGEPPALLTRWVGTRSLADAAVPMAPDQAAALCLAVAATLGRLHRAGVVHGSVEPAHVLLDPHGRPVLCGFGGAGPIGEPARRATTDPTGAGAPHDRARPALRPAIDVAGLGGLLDHLLGPASTGGLGRTARRTAVQRRALAAVSAHARLDDPAARPSIAAFTRAVRKAAPQARLSPGGTSDPEPVDPEPAEGRPHRSEDLRGPADPADRPTDPADRADHADPLARTKSLPRRPSTRTRTGGRGSHPRPARPSRPRRASERRGLGGILPAVIALAVIAATTYFGLSAWWSPGPDRTATARPAPLATEAPRSVTTPTDGRSETSGVDDPDRSAPSVVDHRGRRYAIGAADDVVQVGPWLCDGRTLAVVLRPADGSLHLFDAWAEPGGELGARPVGVVPGATRLSAASDGPGCAVLVVSDDVGPLTTLSTEDLS